MEELNTAEQIESRGRANAARMHKAVHHALRPGGSASETSFSALVPPGRVSRKDAAAHFHALLMLKKQHVLEVLQSEPFADITISRGPDFTAKP